MTITIKQSPAVKLTIVGGVPGAPGAISVDAPNDGTEYVRKNGVWVTADQSDLKPPSEADFFARSELHKAMYAGSGFVEWGKQSSAAVTETINEGLWVHTTAYSSLSSYPNTIWLGNKAANTPDGASRTGYPLVNVGGALIAVSETNNDKPTFWENVVKFPPAPTATNLVTNGTFDTDTSGWTGGSGGVLSAVGGRMEIANGSASQGYAKLVSIPTIPGQTYLFEMDIDHETGTNVQIYIGSTDGSSDLLSKINLTAGVKRYDFVASSTVAWLWVRTGNTTVGAKVSVDNISVIAKSDLSRQDLAFLESWHEVVADKDVVYPFGNVQFGATTWEGNALVNTAVAVGYSAFGEWETAPVAGYGVVWSTASAAVQAEFLADPLNNLYTNELGQLTQVRYRIRTVQGLGDDWGDTVDPLKAGYFYSSDGALYVKPQGALTAPLGGADFGPSTGGLYSTRAGSWGSKFASTDKGIYTGVDSYEDVNGLPATVAYNGLCFALPLALVQRRNRGAYHPVLNEHGSAKIMWADGSVAVSEWYNASVKTPATTADCFTSAPVTSNTAGNSAPFIATDIGQGKIGETTGRPDGKYYDAIYASDVKDLRNSAHKVEDMTRLLQREFNRTVAGETRGFEGEKRLFVGVAEEVVSGHTGVVIPFTYGHIASGDRFHIWNIDTASDLGYTDTHGSGNLNLVYVAAGTAQVGDNILVTLNPTATKRTLDATPLETGNHAAETLLHCDIIGDPANYFRGHYDWTSDQGSQELSTGQVVLVVDGSLGIGGVAGHFYEYTGVTGTADLNSRTYSGPFNDLGTDRAGSWVTEGIAGTPLLVDENGNSLIPDGTSKTFKMSRKVGGSILLTLFSDDSGNTWGTSAAFDAANGASNSITGTIAATRIYLVFYTTKANPTTLAANSEVLSLGDMWASEEHSALFGSNLSSSLVGKVPVGSTTPSVLEQPLSRRTLNTAGNVLHAVAGLNPQHRTFPLGSTTSSAVKVLPYLSRLNGRAMLHLLYKEMRWDSAADAWTDTGSLTVSNGVAMTAGNLYKVIQSGSALEGMIIQCLANANVSDWTGAYLVGGDIYANSGAKVTSYVLWDGNGWGDNNQFTVLDNESTETDDNGNSVIIGQRSIPLPYFISDGE